MSKKHSAIATTDTQRDDAGEKFHSIVLEVKLTEDAALKLVDDDWHDEVLKLTGPHGGFSMNLTEVRAAYDIKSLPHRKAVVEKLREKFTFSDPK